MCKIELRYRIICFQLIRGQYKMSSYNLNQLIKKWTKEELTTEQAVGQILLQIQTLSTRIGTLEKRFEQNRKENGKKSER